jgi:threonine/homoserine/homoserine lactone efflux protein
VLNPGDMLTITLLVMSGLTIGVLIAAPTGPVNIVCVQRTLERGFWGGFTAGVGAVLADGLLATLAAFGVTAISGIMATYQQELQLIGGLVMVAFGVKLFTVEPKLAKRRNGTTLSELRRIVDWVPEQLRPALRFQIWRMIPHASVIPQTFFLTVLNPGAILAFLAFFSGLGSIKIGPENYLQAGILVLSVMTGSLLWWAFLAHLIGKLHNRVNERRLKFINQGMAVLLLAFGGALFFQFAAQVMGHGANAPTLPPAPASVVERTLLGHSM